jgi:pilus assembly protein FimV
MQKGKQLKLACLATLAILPLQGAYALGIGKLTMNSALDEPLDARIELTSVTESELESLEIGLANATTFRRAGIDRGESVLAIEFSLEKDTNGRPYIQMRTPQPFRDPFLHVIVRASWSSGQLQREYTALLDPPAYLIGPAARVETPATPAMPSAPMTAPPASKPAAPAARAMAPAPISPAEAVAAPADAKLGPPMSDAMSQVPAAAGYSPGSVYGPIQNGEILWDIASQVRAVSGHDMAQIMMAIFRENPSAFLNDNINLLRTGQSLRIPDSDNITRTSVASAQQELRVQMEEWQDYKDRLAGASSTVAVDTGEAEATPPTARVESSEAAPAAEDDVLKIVRAKVEDADEAAAGQPPADADQTKAATDSEASAAYQERIEILEESLASAELEKTELSTRVKLLEEQIDKANKLIDIQTTDLARLQAQSASTVAESGEQPTAVMGKQAAEKAEVKPAAKPSADKKPAAKPLAKQPAEKQPAQKEARVQPAEEPGFFDTVKDFLFSSWVTTLGIVTALVLILVGLFVVIRRRRSIAEFEDSIISGTAVLDISTAESTEPSESRTDTSFLSDFVPGMGNVQADEVDPLAEAEVYMAYGRDEQAEEVLKDASAKNPDRHELKLKLLEIYQNRKDVTSFETLAEELYPADGKVPTAVWAKVVEMGKIVSPDNPLFQGEVAGAAVSGDTLFGDKTRAEDKSLGDLLDTGETESRLDSLDEPTEETVEQPVEKLAHGLDDITEELPEDITEELAEEVTGEITEELQDISDEGDMLDELKALEDEQASSESGIDFPEPDEEVLDLDFGDFNPDQDQETSSFEVDSLDLDKEGMASNDSDTIDTGLDFDMDDIDLDLGVEDEVEEKSAESSEALEMPGLEELDSLDLDSDSSESASLDSSSEDTAELLGAGENLHDETLEFADLDDLTLEQMEDVSAAGEAEAETTDAADETWDEAGTKLDLARAYIEMDDKESAISILREVAEEGSDSQKKEAQDLLSEIDAG